MNRRADIIKVIKSISGKYSEYEIFTDWIRCMALSISNTVTFRKDDVWHERERMYVDTMRKYTEEEVNKLCEMTMLLVETLEEGPDDVLGKIYMESGMGSKAAGQFFTPFHVAELTAKLAIHAHIDEYMQGEKLTINEPTCGGGAMIIASAKALKDEGKELWILTGDNEETAREIAVKAGVDHVLSGVLPEDKARKIRELKAQGKTVCMVGDGINDTPALATADISVAMGTGSDIAIESASLLLPAGKLSKLREAFSVSRKTMGTVRQNLRWALAYNLVSIPVAAAGLLHPSLCAMAMSASSIGVLMNSLKLQKLGKSRERKHIWKK